MFWAMVMATGRPAVGRPVGIGICNGLVTVSDWGLTGPGRIGKLVNVRQSG